MTWSWQRFGVPTHSRIEHAQGIHNDKMRFSIRKKKKKIASLTAILLVFVLYCKLPELPTPQTVRFAKKRVKRPAAVAWTTFVSVDKRLKNRPISWMEFPQARFGLKPSWNG